MVWFNKISKSYLCVGDWYGDCKVRSVTVYTDYVPFKGRHNEMIWCPVFGHRIVRPSQSRGIASLRRSRDFFQIARNIGRWLWTKRIFISFIIKRKLSLRSLSFQFFERKPKCLEREGDFWQNPSNEVQTFFVLQIVKRNIRRSKKILCIIMAVK